MFPTGPAATTNLKDGIVAAGETTPQPDSVLMSPQELKVEARQSPYTTVTAKTLMNSKSTMV